MKPLNWEFPYSSRRMPVLANNIVATSQPLAAQAGLKMLQNGGNATDAALATAIALTVLEPTMNGIGSDAFAIIWDGVQLHGLNASGRSPTAWNYEDFSRHASMPQFGWNTVTVPGAVSAWSELSRRFGNLPFQDLFEPAIIYAHNGYLVSPIIAQSWKNAKKTYRNFQDFGATFLPNGKSPRAGEKFECKAQAKTLKRIAETRGETFYQGEIAEEIVAYAKTTGGLISKEDLATHQANWVEPISIPYNEVTLHEIPPNGQGIAALMALGILKKWNITDYPMDSADSLHLQIEAMKLAFSDAHRYVSDPTTRDIEVADLLDPSYLLSRAKQIDLKSAQISNFGHPGFGETVYLTAADTSGMMVSFIQSNYQGFGSGIVLPNTGISFQNRGFGFSLEKGHPNQVDGGKRPYHTIIPAFVTQNGQPLMSFGVMGGPMQPQGHTQMMTRIFDYSQNPQAACDAPRWRVLEDKKVAFEHGIKPSTLEDLSNRGHDINFLPKSQFGGGQFIYKLQDGYCGASDSRKDGQATGF